MSSRPGSSSGDGSGYRPEDDHPSTFSTAPAGRPGSSFNNPLVYYHASSNPTAERYYVLNMSRGIIETTEPGAREYRADGFSVLDGYGNQVTLFDGELVAFGRLHGDETTEKAFYPQFGAAWELIDMKTAMAEASSDETISFDFETKRFKRVKKAAPESTSKKDGCSPGAASAASGASAVAA